MIRVIIGNSERELSSVDESWINQQINRRRSDGENVCVRVNINKDRLNMALSTPSCPCGSGGRPPNRDEEKLFSVWRKMGLDKDNFSGGNLIAFLRQLNL